MTAPHALVVLGVVLLLAAAGTWGGRSRRLRPWGARLRADGRPGVGRSVGRGIGRGGTGHDGTGMHGTAGRDSPAAADPSEDRDPVADAGVVLELLAVATSATSLPDALRVVGDAVGGSTGLGLTTAGAALVLGAGWDEAWATVSASADAGAASARSRLGPRTLRGGRGHPATPSVLGLVAGCLRPAWEQGAAPASALRAARDRHDREAEARAVEAAERLAVRVVLPLGLCLLPAFVLLGLVPTVIALGSGLL